MVEKNKLHLFNKKKECEGTSILIELNQKEYDSLPKLIKDNTIETKFDCNMNELKVYNSSNSLFLDELYILLSNLKFDDFLIKFQKKMKNVDQNYLIYDYSNNNFKLFSLLDKQSFDSYKLNIEKKNIEIGSIDRENLFITPTFFDKWIKCINKSSIANQHKDAIVNKLTYFRELLSLIYISSRFTYRDNEFIFYIEDTVGKYVEYNHTWLKIEEMSNNNYFTIFNWIENNTENKLSSETLLKIVRTFFLQNGNFKVVKNPIEKLKSLLNIILKNDVETYYDQKNKLKSELFEIEKLMIENKRNILKNLVGLIISIGVGYYGIVFKDSSNFKFIKEDNGLMILFIFMLAATLFFGYTFYLNLKEIEDFYIKIKEVYVNHFLFNEEDFKSLLSKPSWKDLKKYWLLLIIFILIQVILINNYNRGNHGFLAWLCNFLGFLSNRIDGAFQWTVRKWIFKSSCYPWKMFF